MGGAEELSRVMAEADNFLQSPYRSKAHLTAVNEAMKDLPAEKNLRKDAKGEILNVLGELNGRVPDKPRGPDERGHFISKGLNTL